jgi:hypothetical protein
MANMKKVMNISPNLIAACGMNCGICMAYLREKKPCGGCNSSLSQKAKHCSVCHMRNCDNKPEPSSFCYECKKYPCARLKQLDKRYRTKYNMSMIDNLEKIRQIGLQEFVAIENSRWACPGCGNPICVHRHKCISCGKTTGFSINDKSTHDYCA